jgi:general secretion pathway protein L
MSSLDDITSVTERWTESVARTLLVAFDRFAPPRAVRLVEQGDGSIAVEPAAPASGPHAAMSSIHIVDGRVTGTVTTDLAARIKGSRVELVLQPRHFLFRPLELPRRATEFLEGIVRSQIDRLTPWTMQDAVFGCTCPVEIGNDRVALTVAATARALVAPYLQALAGLGAQSVSVYAQEQAADSSAVPIKVVEQTAGGGRTPSVSNEPPPCGPAARRRLVCHPRNTLWNSASRRRLQV